MRFSAVRGQCQILCNGHVSRCAAERILKNAADKLGAPVLGPPADVCTGERNRTGVDEKRSGDGIEQSGFARTVRADDDHKRSVIDRQVDRLQRAQFIRRFRIKGFVDSADFKHGMTGA